MQAPISWQFKFSQPGLCPGGRTRAPLNTRPWCAPRIPEVSWEPSLRTADLEWQIWFSSMTCRTTHLFISTVANQFDSPCETFWVYKFEWAQSRGEADRSTAAVQRGTCHHRKKTEDIQELSSQESREASAGCTCLNSHEGIFPRRGRWEEQVCHVATYSVVSFMISASSKVT